MNILDLSSDLLVAILERADGISLCKCREVCHALHDVVEQTPSLKLKLELYAAGLVRNLSQYPEEAAQDDLSIDEQIARIQRYRDAWRKPSFAAVYKIEGDALYLIAPELRRFHPSGLVALITGDADLSLTQFTTVLGAQQKQQWTIPAAILDTPGIDIFAMDPAQDLLVLVWRLREGGGVGIWHLSFRSLRTGQAHPRALVPTRRLDELVEMQDLPEIDIYGDTVVLQHRCFGNFRKSLWLFKWETGVLDTQFHTKASLKWALLPGGPLVGVNLAGIAVLRYPCADDESIQCWLSFSPSSDIASGRDFGFDICRGSAGPRTPYCRPSDEEAAVVITTWNVQNTSRNYIAVSRAVLLEYLERVRREEHAEHFKWSEWRDRAYAEFWEDAPCPIGSNALVGGPRCAGLVSNPSVPDSESPKYDLRLLEFGPAAVATVAGDDISVDAGPSPSKVLQSSSLRARVRTIPLELTFDDPRMKVYTWEDGVVLEGTDMHVLSLRA